MELKTTVWPSKSKNSLEATKFIKTDSILQIGHRLKQSLALTFITGPLQGTGCMNQNRGRKQSATTNNFIVLNLPTMARIVAIVAGIGSIMTHGLIGSMIWIAISSVP